MMCRLVTIKKKHLLVVIAHHESLEQVENHLEVSLT